MKTQEMTLCTSESLSNSLNLDVHITATPPFLLSCSNGTSAMQQQSRPLTARDTAVGSTLILDSTPKSSTCSPANSS